MNLFTPYILARYLTYIPFLCIVEIVMLRGIVNYIKSNWQAATQKNVTFFTHMRSTGMFVIIVLIFAFLSWLIFFIIPRCRDLPNFIMQEYEEVVGEVVSKHETNGYVKIRDLTSGEEIRYRLDPGEHQLQKGETVTVIYLPVTKFGRVINTG